MGGAIGSGHYTATCLVGDRFFHFNDTSVGAVSDHVSPVGATAYVILLVRRTIEGDFSKGHHCPVVHRQTVSMPHLWPQKFRTGSLEEALKRLRSGTSLSDEIKNPESSYTLSLPDVDLDKLASMRTEAGATLGVDAKKQAEGGCYYWFMRILCGVM